MNLKKTLGLTLAGVLITSNLTVFAEYNPDKVIEGPVTTLSIDVTKEPRDSVVGMKFNLVVNGQAFNPQETKVYLKENGTVMIPLRAVSEALGYKVKWNGDVNTVELTKGAQWIMVKLGEDYYCFGKMAPQKLGTVAELTEDRTYVPLNFAEEILKADVQMDETGGITINAEKISAQCITGIIKTINKTEKSTMVTIEGNGIDKEEVDTIILHIGENTKLVNPITNEGLTIDDLKEGDTVRGYYGPAVTMSIPAQSAAEKIEIIKDAALKTGVITNIMNNGKSNQILIGDMMNGIILTITDETKIVTEDNKELNFSDIKKGMEVDAFHSMVVTASIPPMSSAVKIIVKN